MYSAVKRAGKPLYEYARAGETVVVEPRKAVVKSFEITERLSERQFRFYVSCSKGTYVRTLVHDLGQKLGCGAVTEALTRTQVGAFHIDEAVQLSTLKYVSDIKSHLKAMREVVGN
jgi:tRNA pseudouridine55 synthase